MNNNTSKTLTYLQCLGLDLNEGISPIICLRDLEKTSGLRQNSNGSRIIRRDCPVFSKFKIDFLYSEEGEVVAYKFCGYKDSNDLLTEAASDILKYKQKIERLQVLIETKSQQVVEILRGNYFKYSVEDIFE